MQARRGSKRTNPRVFEHPLSTSEAIAVEYGATLCTTDRDFARFPGLKWINPIAAKA